MSTDFLSKKRKKKKKEKKENPKRKWRFLFIFRSTKVWSKKGIEIALAKLYEIEVFNRQGYYLATVRCRDRRMLILVLDQDIWRLSALYGMEGGYSMVFPEHIRPPAMECRDLVPDIEHVMGLVQQELAISH